jgi:hypothetical protein
MNINIERPVEVLLRNLQRLHGNIVFADRKAAVLMAADSGLLAAVYSVIRRDERTQLIIMSLIASILLIVGIAFGFTVITPRGRQNRSRGLGHVDGDRIAQYQNAGAYVAAMANTTQAAIIEELQLLTYDYAQIDKRKYTWLRVTVFVSAAGAVFALITCVSSRL